MNKVPLKKVKSPEELMLEAAKLNNYDLDKIKGSIKELEMILENNVVGDQLLRNLDNIHKDVSTLKDRVTETYIRLLKRSYEIS
jgi:hypothetical protein